MKPNTENIENFTKFIMTEVRLEKPSADFVENVMGKINLENTPVIETSYKPLISKSGWFIISLITIVFFVYLIFGSTANQPVVVSFIDVNFLNGVDFIAAYENIQIPDLFSVLLLVFTVLVVFQMFAIKNYFNRIVENNYS